MDGEHEWLRNYLPNRTLIIEFVSSAAELVSVGVPQESTLGPLLCILNVSNYPSAVLECSVLMKANDTVVFFSAPEVSVIQATLVKELQAIECWFHCLVLRRSMVRKISSPLLSIAS